MKKIVPIWVKTVLLLWGIWLSLCGFQTPVSGPFMPDPAYNLLFQELAPTWDEGIPLGNGMLGALIWQKEGKLRISMDRADLWDLRPTANLDQPEWSFSWVKQQWQNRQYAQVQQLFDVPYDRDPAPSKIPACALEFDIAGLGVIQSVQLDLATACCVITWENGTRLETFVHANATVARFRFTGLPEGYMLHPAIQPPPYTLNTIGNDLSPVSGQDLSRLGYAEGQVQHTSHSISYTQPGWGGFRYRADVEWQQKRRTVSGFWTITSGFDEKTVAGAHQRIRLQANRNGYMTDWKSHSGWWAHFWQQSGIRIPDKVLARQWYLEMYKLGACTGNGAPPISLQAIWTADNGKLPPWKGDFHNDLNTQLSYWPAYSSNHLPQARGFIDWLERNKPAFYQYTQQYFGAKGINVPGVSTLTGQPMGGWIQYAFSPTVSAWLAHHYYLQWRYSMDKDFLSQKAYPWLREVAIYLEAIAEKTPGQKWRLPLSSTPEMFDNSPEAWFATMTNYDLALVRWTYTKAAELATELGLHEEAMRWTATVEHWDSFDIHPEEGLTYAAGVPYAASNRHFSHLLAYHPLGLMDISQGDAASKIIQNTLKNLDKQGSDWYCGYSFSWLGNLKARAMDGEGAARALTIFAENFCLKNSFHANGDQGNGNFSKFRYRPFTLEGNMAFAAGMQEMLLQSHAGYVRVFPAIPAHWKALEFHQLRTEGAFLVSARMQEGKVTDMHILAEAGGMFRLKNPFGAEAFQCSVHFVKKGEIIEVLLKKGQKAVIKTSKI